MRQHDQQSSPFETATTVIGYVAGAIVAFFGWPAVFAGSIATVEAYAATHYAFVPSSLLTGFWGLLILFGLFGVTALIVTLAIQLTLKAAGRL